MVDATYGELVGGLEIGVVVRGLRLMPAEVGTCVVGVEVGMKVGT